MGVAQEVANASLSRGQLTLTDAKFDSMVLRAKLYYNMSNCYNYTPKKCELAFVTRSSM